jgi:simple sugar transport system permease protein
VSRRQFVLAAGAPIASIGLALVVSSLVLLAVGSNPFSAYSTMAEYGTRLETFIDTLNRATPLYISGVAVAIGFRMNLFNIGVEGQYTLAALVAAYVGAQFDVWAPLHVIAILLVAMAVGSGYAAIPGVLKVTRGVNEVISTIMLNAIAVAIVSYLLVKWSIADETLNTATEMIPTSGRMPDLNSVVETVTREISKGRELRGFLVVAVLVGIAYHVLINRTRIGFDLRATGSNPFAAHASGVPPERTIVIAMALSGMVAGLVGLSQVLGDTYRYDLNFTRQLGFSGIAVALVGRNHPAGIAVGALLFGFLDSVAPILDFSGDAPREIVIIMQAVIIFSVVVGYEIVRRIRATDEARAAAAALATRPEPSA